MIKYKISEIFESINGEPPFFGVPALFIRFYGCNLTCSWCDTKYSWQSGEFEIYDENKLKSIIANTKHNLVIFTGGEPLLWKTENLLDDKHIFLYETNGTINPNNEIVKKHNVYFAISPKLSNANVPYVFKMKDIDPLNAIFKFVIVNVKEDLEELQKFIEQHNLHEYSIFVTVDGMLPDSEYLAKLRELWWAVVNTNYNLYVQMHRIAFGSGEKRKI